jgi:hypothetical protein
LVGKVRRCRFICCVVFESGVGYCMGAGSTRNQVWKGVVVVVFFFVVIIIVVVVKFGV